MHKQKLSIIILAAVFALLMIVHFAILVPLANNGDEGTKPPLPEGDPGEGVIGVGDGVRYLMIDRQIQRKEIQSIKVVNENSDFMFIKQKITLAPKASSVNYSEEGSFSDSKTDVVNYYLDANGKLQPLPARVSSTVGDRATYTTQVRGSYSLFVYIVSESTDAPNSAMKVSLESGEITSSYEIKTRGSSGKHTYTDGSWVKIGTYKFDGDVKVTVENIAGNLNVGNIRLIQNDYDEAAAKDFYEPITTSNYTDGEQFIIADHSILTFDPDKFSYLVVSTGYPLSSKKVQTGLSESELEEYGLAESQNPVHYELVTTEGVKYTVYIGDRIPSNGGYYMRNADRSTVYIVADNSYYSPGAVIHQPLEYYVEPTICTPTESAYTYTYVDGFTIFKNGKFIDTKGEIVKAGQIVDVTYTIRDENGAVYNENIDVTTSITLIEDEDFSQKFLDNIIGRAVGDSFTFEYTDKDKKLTYEMKINYALELELFLVIDRMKNDEADITDASSLYKMLYPLSSYGVNGDAHGTLLQELTELKGSETVAIGLDDATMKKYGLYSNHVSFDIPYGVKTDAHGNVTCDYAMANYLYISDLQPGGFYYVGVQIYDIVVKVAAEDLNFLKWEVMEWVDYHLFSVNIADVTDMTFSSSAGDFHFTLGKKLVNGEDLLYVIDQNSGFVVGSNMNDFDTECSEVFKQFYMGVLSVHYEGDADLTREEIEALTADDSRCILTYSFTLVDGRVITYKFYPYSERRSLVVKDGEAFFCTATYSVKKMISDIGLLLDGRIPDWEARY